MYKGLAINSSTTAPLIYAANFSAGKIDVFNGTFSPTTAPGGFTDPSLPAGYAPFNIWNLGGKLYVMYAKQDATKGLDVAGAGNGVVDVFDFDGNLQKRLITNSALNSPWGAARLPRRIGAHSAEHCWWATLGTGGSTRSTLTAALFSVRCRILEETRL